MSTFSVNQIEDEIISILTSGSLDTNLVWHKGEPSKGSWEDYPYGYVTWVLGDRFPQLAEQAKMLETFRIIWRSRYHDNDEAEKEALSKLKEIETLLKSYPTLNNKVEAAWISHREKEAAIQREDYSIIGVRIELKARYKES